MKNKGKHRFFKIGLPVLVVILVAVSFLLPLPKYIEGPGGADKLSNIVNIKNHPDNQKGKFMLTSVGIMQATPASYLYAKLNPYYSIESVESVTGGQNSATYDRLQTFYMQSAINEAIYTAYRAAGQSVTKDYKGIYIIDVLKTSKFKGLIHVGDTIVKVNGHHFNSALGYQNYIRKQKVGAPLKIGYYHNAKYHEVTKPLTKLPNTNQAGIGITLTDDLKVTTKIPIKVDPGQIGGPSGGLMFSLQIYSQLTGDNIRKGRNIAGTGTINSDGSVGEIGGIDKKIIAAKRNGATIFLAPYIKPTKAVKAVEPGHLTNYELAVKTAKRYAPNMKVIPVTSFKDALNKLK
ncbi:SepM family pheromone-processing serine protease [Lactobacillus sp. Sy-1]|uniref:SepM family pheromone-processing serine protease n=1 Tax=Lactobacillus sp. Sy-1 TaxID=2109645 RepID=UPI001C5A488E|nr:SepM family pheromone-processing serine protease [Lactobacillus sp. Sy-1]MBW1605447.1 PDZ domain-containing protein [Lactobacillus sp. Sy-1]